jgi:hypothetical protein
MNYGEFIQLVERMRNAQREYFRTKSPTALESSKRLEREVDQAIARERSGQRTMFEE